jgi:ankyrin repeat protein
MFDRLEMLELLLSRGAASEHTDADGRTALDYARGMGAQRTTARLTELRQTRERQCPDNASARPPCALHGGQTVAAARLDKK